MADSSNSDENEATRDKRGDSPETPVEDINTSSYQHAIEDARRTFDHQIAAYEDVDEKSWRVLRFNGLVATIAAVGVVNISPPFSIYEVGMFVLGVGLLGISTLFVFRGRPHNEIELGAGREFFDRVEAKNPPEGVYLRWTIQQYTNWIEKAKKRTVENSSRIDLAKLLSLLGVGILLVGGLYHTVSLGIT